MDVFDAVADPVRRRILEALADGPSPAGALAAMFPEISRPAVSRHLRVLREAGLVEHAIHGRQRRYAATIAPLGEIVSWVGALQPPFTRRLDALETEVYRTRRERAASVAHNGADDPPSSEKERTA